MAKYTDEERIKHFWARANITDLFGCWEWTAGKNGDGYGNFRWHGKHIGTHRLSYLLVYGMIPKGMLVLHHCDNPPCVNPCHLFLGTHQDNADDMKQKGRSPERSGERNSRAILKLIEVAEIRKKYSCGERRADLALKYGVAPPTIDAVISGRNWR